ncbi:MAG: DUF5683 domain-containing protein [Bacteroidaceae bacterium]|nr:DUF5683 domain-containing protein [Bacteroidaceae bacterium]
MTAKIKICVLCCLLYVPLIAYGQASQKIRPQWLKNYQDIVKDGANYQIILVDNQGPSIETLQNGRLNTLGSYLQSSSKIDGEIDWNASSTTGNTDSNYSTHTLSFKTKTSVETFGYKFIDDYWERIGDYYKYSALYAVTEPGSNTTIKDTFIKNSSYVSDPITWGLSLIPGAAQMHKGSYVKGGIIMVGGVALAGGFIAFENMRSEYMSKITRTHVAHTKKAHNNKANNCETARNLCIGGFAALYIYNIVDAYIAPGARRIIVTPTATTEGQYGISASYNF